MSFSPLSQISRVGICSNQRIFPSSCSPLRRRTKWHPCYHPLHPNSKTYLVSHGEGPSLCHWLMNLLNELLLITERWICNLTYIAEYPPWTMPQARSWGQCRIKSTQSAPVLWSLVSSDEDHWELASNMRVNHKGPMDLECLKTYHKVALKRECCTSEWGAGGESIWIQGLMCPKAPSWEAQPK